MLKERGKSIVPDLVDFLKKHIVPLKKGEVVRGEFVLDIGSNDSTLLDILRLKGYKTFGIEPATNLANSSS